MSNLYFKNGELYKNDRLYDVGVFDFSINTQQAFDDYFKANLVSTSPINTYLVDFVDNIKIDYNTDVGSNGAYNIDSIFILSGDNHKIATLNDAILNYTHVNANIRFDNDISLPIFDISGNDLYTKEEDVYSTRDSSYIQLKNLTELSLFDSVNQDNNYTDSIVNVEKTLNFTHPKATYSYGTTPDNKGVEYNNKYYYARILGSNIFIDEYDKVGGSNSHQINSSGLSGLSDTKLVVNDSGDIFLTVLINGTLRWYKDNVSTFTQSSFTNTLQINNSGNIRNIAGYEILEIISKGDDLYLGIKRTYNLVKGKI